MRNWKSTCGALVLTAAFVFGSAMSCETHGDADSDKVDNAPADIIQFPDGFRNVAHKCDGPNMVYSGSSGVDSSFPAAVAVVSNDPRCTGVFNKPVG